MNKQEKEWLDYYKECNDLDYAQIERFEPKVQEDILRTKLLIEIIEKIEKQEDSDKNDFFSETRWLKLLNESNKQLIDALKKEIEIKDKIIESFENGEMKIGTRIETNS